MLKQIKNNAYKSLMVLALIVSTNVLAQDKVLDIGNAINLKQYLENNKEIISKNQPIGISNEDIEPIERIGDEKEGLRIDVEEKINNSNLNEIEAKALKEFARALQKIQYTDKKEMITPEHLTALNIYLMQTVLKTLKDSSDADIPKIKQYMKLVEIHTLNTKLRKDQYMLFEEVTKYYMEQEPEWMLAILKESFRLVFNKYPEYNELKMWMEKISD